MKIVKSFLTTLSIAAIVLATSVQVRANDSISAALETAKAEAAAEELSAKLVAGISTNEISTSSNSTEAAPVETAAVAETSLEAKKAEAKLPENQIPVFKSQKEIKKTGGSDFGRVMITLGVLAIVLGAAAFGTRKWIAKSVKNNQHTQIKVLTQHHLGPKKSLAIVRVAGETILIGVTDQNISMLKSLALLDEDIPESEEVPQKFDQALADTDDFAMQGLSDIRDVVSSRLKNMRNI